MRSAARRICTQRTGRHHTKANTMSQLISASGRSLLRASTVAMQQGFPAHAAASSSLQQQHQQHRASSTTQPQQPAADPFTRSLQQKTEQELLSLLDKARLAVQQEQDAGGASGVDEDEEGEDELVDLVNAETGEVAGPRGKEPTRYGDWEVKGRATDFA